ncbi:MAG: hypothetical protein ACMXYK_04050 [Candidatus Woesearchaeota archaeon]
MKQILLTIAVLVLVFIAGCAENVIDTSDEDNRQFASSFDECVEMGFPVMTSYPGQCNDGNQTFIQELDELDVPSSSGSFEACVAAGNPVMESYPRQCFDGSQMYVEEVEAPDTTNMTPAEACEAYRGTWIESAEECEGISQNVCEDLGGNYNECASACRNDPDAEFCTMQCVFVCEFAGSEQTDFADREILSCSENYPGASGICTREYNPVCGIVDEATGATQTFGNGCEACSDERVENYAMGEC